MAKIVSGSGRLKKTTRAPRLHGRKMTTECASCGGKVTKKNGNWVHTLIPAHMMCDNPRPGKF